MKEAEVMERLAKHFGSRAFEVKAFDEATASVRVIHCGGCGEMTGNDICARCCALVSNAVYARALDAAGKGDG